MRQKEEVGRVVVYILAKGVGAYPGEGAYQSVGAYSRKYGNAVQSHFIFQMIQGGSVSRKQMKSVGANIRQRINFQKYLYLYVNINVITTFKLLIRIIMICIHK